MPNVLYLWSICKARLMFWTWNDTSLATKKLQRTRTSNLLQNDTAQKLKWWRLWDIHLISCTASSDPQTVCQTYLSHIMTFFLTSCWHEPEFLSGISFDILSDILSDISSDILSDISSGWGPTRHTELTWSRLRSGTQHWPHMIVVEVRNATLASHIRGWGPTRNTGLTRSQWRSGTEHWAHIIAVGDEKDRRTRRRRRRRRRRRTRLT